MADVTNPAQKLADLYRDTSGTMRQCRNGNYDAWCLRKGCHTSGCFLANKILEGQNMKPEHTIIVGQRTLRLLAQGKPVTVNSYDESCRVTLIHASDYPHEAVLDATKGNPNAE